MDGDVVVSTPANGVRWITLVRPQRRNALSIALRKKLVEAIAAARRDDSVAIVALAGDGPVFCAGSDLKEAGSTPAEERVRSWQALWQEIGDCEKPIIAVVEGAALGAGFELALACDVIVAGQTTSFALPEVKFGFLPGGGGTQRLVRQVGKYQAMRLILVAQPLDAAEALAIGLVSEVVVEGEAAAAGLRLAKTIAAMPLGAALRAKALLLSGPNLPLNEALALEAKLLAQLNGTPDQMERAAAFTSKNSQV